MNIAYCCLRWPDEVPFNINLKSMSNEVIDQTFGDIDLLIDLKNFDKLIPLSNPSRKGIKVDVYSSRGSKGMSFRGIPYFPPNKSYEILKAANKNRYSFYTLEGATYIKALVYHLTYQKALNSGIPSGVDSIMSITNPKRNYQKSLLSEAHKHQVKLPDTITLKSLHKWLKDENWAIPYDLIPRWPIKCPFIDFLQKNDARAYKEYTVKYPNLIVYILRGELKNHPVEKAIEKKLESKFTLLKKAEMTKPQVDRCISNIRGGNWLSKDNSHFVAPYKYLIYYDKNPDPSINESLQSKYPEVCNNNIFLKHEIRQEIKKQTSIDNAIHSSDNALEAFHMYSSLFSFDKIEDLTNQLNKIIHE
ncbi:hypothetical protein [Lentisphaera araneosa]|nr:hypothetical protein [Lentisphaera araneosa]